MEMLGRCVKWSLNFTRLVMNVRGRMNIGNSFMRPLSLVQLSESIVAKTQCLLRWKAFQISMIFSFVSCCSWFTSQISSNVLVMRASSSLATGLSLKESLVSFWFLFRRTWTMYTTTPILSHRYMKCRRMPRINLVGCVVDLKSDFYSQITNSILHSC